MSKVVRVQEGDYKVLLGKDDIPNNFIIDTNSGSFNAATGDVIIKGNLSVTGTAPSPRVSNVMYVTVDGDDANDGRGEGPGQAKRTIKSAVEAAQEGTTIFVRSGEYYEDNPIRLPPKVSIIGDNLRRTILRPLNGPRKFSATSIERTGTIVTVTTNVSHEFKLHDRVRVIIPNPASPKDRTTHILDTECANITEIVDQTTFRYIDPNFTDIPFTTTTIGTVEQGVDFFLVSNQSYIAQLVFRGFQAPGYAINIDKDAIVDTSPYIQNCSNINGPWLRNGTEWLPFITEQPNLNGQMVKGPRPLRDDEILPSAVEEYGVNDRGASGGMLIDGDRYNPESPLKSMVADAFTQVAQGGVGFHITNFGYMQLVSCFAVFCDKAFYTTNGGYMSISNSVIDFGNYGFIADGYYPTPYATGLVEDPYYSIVGSITVTNNGAGYTIPPTATVESPLEGVTAEVEVSIDPFRQSVNAISVIDTGSGYTTSPKITINPPFLPFVEWESELPVSNGDYILFEGREYLVNGNGNLGQTVPTESGAPQINGDVTLTLVGLQATAIVNLSTNISITVSNLSEKPQVGSIAFIGNNPIGYYIKSANTSTLGFRFNEIKCRRDVAYIVDAVLSDAVFNTNFRTIYAARAYLRSYSSKVLSLQKQQTIEAIQETKQSVINLLGFVPSNNVDIGTLFDLVVDIIDNENPNVAQPIFTVPNYANNDSKGFYEAGQILQANREFLKNQIVKYINDNFKGFIYDANTCSRDIGLIIDAVGYDLITNSNFASSVAGAAYYRAQASGVTGGQLPQTLDAIRYARDLAVSFVDGSLQYLVINAFNNVYDILETGIVPNYIFSQNGSTTPDTIAASNTLRSNISAYQTSVSNYLNTNFNAVWTALGSNGQETCQRDVAYIVNAVSYDLLYGGNYQSVIAGEAYYSFGTLQIDSTELTATLAAYEHLKIIMQADVPTFFATINSLIDDITDTISTGVAPTTVYPLITNEDFIKQDVFNALQTNKTVIQNSVIAYIDLTYNSYGYNEAKCSRDVGIIVNAVLDDLVLGSNYLSKTAALSYLRSYSNKVTDKQKIPTIAGIERAKNLVLKYLQDELDSEIVIKQLFDTVVNVIRSEDSASVPVSNYTDPINTPQLIIDEVRIIETEKNNIIKNVLDFINQYLNPDNIVNYSEKLCKRDLEYIVDAVIFDLLYGGNTATTTVAKSFYTASGINVVNTQIFEHVNAFNKLKELLTDVAPVTEDYIAEQTNPEYNGYVGHAELIQIIIDGLSDQNTIPVVPTTPFATRGSLFSYYNNERTKIQGLIPSIQQQVVDYINQTFKINFDYDETTCRRDIDYIIDALTYDLTYGGNTQTTNAALAYSEGSVIEGEINETVAAYKYWKEILPYVLQNQPVPNSISGQVTSVNVGNPVPAGYPSFITQNLIQIIIDSIDYGPGYVPEPVTESNFNLGANDMLGFKTTVMNQIVGIQDSVIDYLNSTYGEDITIEIYPGVIDIPENTTIKFHNVSTISTGGTALEYVGAGVTYNALPFFGGESIPEHERIEINNGRCFTVTNDQVGNFRVGSLFAVDALTGEVTIDANNVSLNGINSIGPFKRNGISVGVELQEVSNNPNLVSSIGSQDVNTVPTQFAVATYVENRYLNKVQSTTPQTVESEISFLNNINIEGNLTVNGDTITINATTLTVDDKNIELASTETPSDELADGGGITLKGTTDKTIIWTDATDAWNSSENWNLADTKVYRINSTDVLSSTGILNNTENVTAFGTATNISLGAATGTLTVNNQQTVFNSTDSIKIPVGTTEQRDSDPQVGQIRYNSELSTFEGFGPGDNWGSLGGVKDVDGNTYVIAELAPAANDNTLWFYNNGVQTLTITETDFNLQSPVVMTLNNTTNTTSSSTGALVVKGGVGVDKDLTVAGTIITPNANNISIGTPELGILDGAVEMTEATSLTNGVSQLNQILTLLVPLPPPNFPDNQNLTVNGTTSRIMFTDAVTQSLNGTGITAPAAGTVVRVIRANTFNTSTITDTGPGNRGSITVNRNGAPAVTKTLTYGNTTQIISAAITETVAIGSNVVRFTQPDIGVLFPGYLLLTGSSGAFGGLSTNTYYYITAVTATTLSLSNYDATTGTIGTLFSATNTATGNLSFTSNSDNGTYTSNNTSLIVGNNVAFPLDTPGFHEIVDLSVNGTSVPAGWNTVQISHSQASSTTIGSNTTNVGIWYYDDSPTVAPLFDSQTFTLGTSSLTYSSTIPHYNSSTTYDIGFDLSWNPGQTGHSNTATNILTTAAIGPWTSAGNKTYDNLGYNILPTTTTVSAGTGPNSSTFIVNVVQGFGAWTTTSTVPVYTANNSYTTATTSLPSLGAIILYKTGTTSSTTFLDETNIAFTAAVGGSTAGATRCVNPDAGTASTDTPVFTAGSALFDSQNGTLYDTDAIVVGTGTNVNSLKHDLTNYSTGFLPVGPNLSTRSSSDPQYFTFRFVRTGVGKFSITYTTTTGVAKIYCAMPGTGGISGTTSTLNKWLDMGIDNSLANGCALAGNHNPGATGTLTYNCSFGTLSSTNATNNEIWVRIRLNPGQSLTRLTIGPSTV